MIRHKMSIHMLSYLLLIIRDGPDGKGSIFCSCCKETLIWMDVHGTHHSTMCLELKLKIAIHLHMTGSSIDSQQQVDSELLMA